MKHDWPAMFLGSFKSDESFKLMNVICSTIKNNVSTLDIDDIDAESLKLLNKTILQKVRNINGRGQKHRQKISANYLKKAQSSNPPTVDCLRSDI